MTGKTQGASLIRVTMFWVLGEMLPSKKLYPSFGLAYWRIPL